MTRLSPVRERWFPQLAVEDYSVTSPATDRYNCFAWVLRLTNTWVEPNEDDPLALFRESGFSNASDAELAPGWEHVAVYADEQGVTHAALQLPSGRWTSKLGSWEDIEHERPDSLRGPLYGDRVTILRSRREL